MGTGILLAVMTFLTLASLACAVAAVLAARQSRVQNLPDVVAVRGIALEARQDVNALRSEWKSTLGAMDAAMEALEDKADTIQRRRKRVEQANRRADQREQIESAEDQDPMESALHRARSQGLPV